MSTNIVSESLIATLPGRTYTEREVSDALAEFHPDFFTLRRELVELGLLKRENGVYWRVVGGGPDALPSPPGAVE